MKNVRSRSIWIVVLADVLLTYAYVFVSYTLMDNVELRAAPLSHWLAQPWVYSLIAPVAAVASWCGARQVRDVWAGRVRWGRQPLEGIAIGAACVVLWGLLSGSWSDFLPALLDVILLCAGLGLLLTCANVPLARLLRPDSASADGAVPIAPGLTPRAG
jgi:hypothetical protein